MFNTQLINADRLKCHRTDSDTMALCYTLLIWQCTQLPVVKSRNALAFQNSHILI